MSYVRRCLGLVAALTAWVGDPQTALAMQSDPGELQVAVVSDPASHPDASPVPPPADLASLATTRALGMAFLSDLLVYNQLGDLGATAFLSSNPPVITTNLFTGHARGTAALAPSSVPEAERVGTGLNGTAVLLAYFSPHDFAEVARGRGTANRPPELGWAPRWWLLKYDVPWIR
jgi:hypothetical protein